MAAENNIVVKVTAETDLSSAQIQLRNLTEESKRLEQQMKDLDTQEKADIKQLQKLGMASKSTINGYEKERKRVQELINANQQNIASLKNQVKQYNLMNGAGNRMAMQLRGMREELMRMEEAGDNNSQAFINLSIAAAKLQDQMGDTQQRIRVLASDTKDLDAAMSVGAGLTGVFNTATSAVELFGGDMEGLQEAFYKVQAATSILYGVQEVANVLNKDSTAMVVLNTAMEKLRAKAKLKTATAEGTETAATVAGTAATTAETTATGAATTAQIAFNAAMAANPIGVIVGIILAAVAAVTALGIGVYKLVTYFSAAGKAQRDYAKSCEELERIQARNAMSEARRSYQREQTQRATNNAMEDEIREAKKRNASEIELANIKVKYAKLTATETIKYANDEINRNNEVVRTIKAKRDAKASELATYKEGSKKYKKAQEELTGAENEYYEAVQKGQSIAQERTDALNAQKDAEQELADLRMESANSRREQAKQAIEERKTMQKEYEDVVISLMDDGKEKEIAQINSQYKEQISAVKGNSKEAVQLRKALRAKEAKEIEEVNKKYAEEETKKRIEQDKVLMQVEVDQKRHEAEKLTGVENKEYQLETWMTYYEARKIQIRENAKYEISNAKDDAAQIVSINQQMQSDIEDIDEEALKKRISIEEDEVRERQRILEQAQDGVSYSEGTGGKLEALKYQYEAEMDLYDAQQQILEAKWAKGVITYQDYQDQLLEISRNRTQAEIELETNKMQAITEGLATAMDYAQQVSDTVFESLGSQVQAELDALDEMYTTDAEEAAKDSKKKLISEEEYEKKKAALEEKQAKYNKTQALIDAAINTALAITSTIGQLGTTPWGIASAAIAAAMGAAQIAVIASKPLAQYAKGRDGGEGEYALVGEKGAEIMYVPKGASIIPHDKISNQDAWGAYGVPKLDVPELPNTNMTDYSNNWSTNITIDYDKLGEAVARNIPSQKTVSVNIDRNGIVVTDGNATTKYLNRKYTGTWN